ncbi:hypothetical protein MRB53_015457 [Persea americana]|nr:hypothetical protein MRB53_015457 [Persea americana]
MELVKSSSTTTSDRSKTPHGCSHAQKNSDVSTTTISGSLVFQERRKAGKATLPPMRAAVNLQLRVFLLSQRRKTGKCRFTAHESGGKAATATFPPLPVEENWKMRFYRPCKRR